MADSSGGIAMDTVAERAHWGPIPEDVRPFLVGLVRAGANGSCVDCGREPYGGGLRCVPCFQARCDAKTVAPAGCGTNKGYSRHLRAGEEPCARCRRAHAADRARRRKVA